MKMSVDKILLLMGLVVAFALLYVLRTGFSCPVEDTAKEGIEQRA